MKRWYVIQLYAGNEQLIHSEIVKRVHELGLESQFGQILIPAAKIQKSYAGDQDEEQQLFPGYMLIEFEATPEAVRLVENTPKVIRFLGGKYPNALSSAEVERILAQISGEVSVMPKRSMFEVGREVEITEGPFSGFVGIIEKVDEEAERLVVMVSIFGRMTPVELDFRQIKR